MLQQQRSQRCSCAQPVNTLHMLLGKKKNKKKTNRHCHGLGHDSPGKAKESRAEPEHAQHEAAGADERAALQLMTVFEGEPCLDEYATLEDVETAARHGATQLVDARSRAQYVGAVRRARYAGRVRGAKSIPYKSLVDKHSEGLLDSSVLQSKFEAAGVAVHAGGIVYCNGGVSACVVLAALQALGAKGWRVYDGSWNEFGNVGDPSLIERHT